MGLFLAPVAAVVALMTSSPALADQATSAEATPVPRAAASAPVPPAAASAPVPPAAAADTTTTTHYAWYGWQVLLADVGATALGFLFTQRPGGDNTALALAGVAYVGGGPAIHLAHERTVSAAVSLGLRIGAPIVGYAIGSAISGCAPGDGICKLFGGVAGALPGIAIASLVDIAALSWEPVGRPGPVHPNRAVIAEVLPTIATTTDADHRRVLSFGVVGTF